MIQAQLLDFHSFHWTDPLWIQKTETYLGLTVQVLNLHRMSLVRVHHLWNLSFFSILLWKRCLFCKSGFQYEILLIWKQTLLKDGFASYGIDWSRKGLSAFPQPYCFILQSDRNAPFCLDSNWRLLCREFRYDSHSLIRLLVDQNKELAVFEILYTDDWCFWFSLLYWVFVIMKYSYFSSAVVWSHLHKDQNTCSRPDISDFRFGFETVGAWLELMSSLVVYLDDNDVAILVFTDRGFDELTWNIVLSWP